jgi:DNA-damage-inducible protein D
MKLHNVKLAGAAKEAGVVEPVDYAIFQNHGYMGLYGGLDMRDIHRRKGLKQSQHILDHMNSTELAANLFRATQTEEKLRRENIKGRARANQTHREVGEFELAEAFVPLPNLSISHAMEQTAQASRRPVRRVRQR